MKIIDLLRSNKFIFSCEFFPPKTEEGSDQLFQAIIDLKDLKPGYVSITYGAGGSTREKTLELAHKIKNEMGVESMAHLTCVGHSKNEIKDI